MIREEIEMTRFRLNAIYTPVRTGAVITGVVSTLMILAGIVPSGPQAAAQERPTPTPTVKQVASDVYFFFDFNGDGVVDDADFLLFAQAYDVMVTPAGDFNYDTYTDDADFSIFVEAFGATVCP